jgi:nitrogen fixation/metabolism regulation signal transduction histidine kinase
MTLILIIIPLVIIPFVAVSLYYNNMSYDTVQGMGKYSEVERICETISFMTLKLDGDLKNYVVLRDSDYILDAKEDLASLRELALEGSTFAYAESFSEIVKHIDRYAVLLDSIRIIVSEEEVPERRIARDLKRYKTKYDSLMSKIVLAKTVNERDSLMVKLKRVSASFDVSKILLGKEQNERKKQTIRQLDISKKTIELENKRILDDAKRRVKEFSETAARYSSRGARNIWTVLILTMGFIVYLIIVLPERIVIPIRRISNIVKRIGKGDLNVSVKGFPKDEMGELVDNIMKMINKVRRVDGLKTQKIHESERKVKFLVNSISEGVILISDEKRILSINLPALSILKLKQQEVEGKLLETIKALSMIHAPLTKLLEQSEKVDTLSFVSEDGVTYQVKVWTIRDAAGTPTGVMLLFSHE